MAPWAQHPPPPGGWELLSAAGGSSCFQAGICLGWRKCLSWQWLICLYHPHICILRLCQEPIPSLVCPQPKNQVGATSKEECGLEKMDSSGGQNSGAEPVNNNQLIIFDQTTISKVVTTRQPQKEGFLWDSMVRPCVGG